ncbi:MAG: Arm DNA-binding domain-containing protein [Bacteroidota bacterium]
MKTTQTFSILIWANKAKATQAGLPLFARITVDGRRAEVSLKRKVAPDRWDYKPGKVIDKSRENPGAQPLYPRSEVRAFKGSITRWDLWKNSCPQRV